MNARVSQTTSRVRYFEIIEKDNEKKSPRAKKACPVRSVARWWSGDHIIPWPRLHDNYPWQHMEPGGSCGRKKRKPQDQVSLNRAI